MFVVKTGRKNARDSDCKLKAMRFKKMKVGRNGWTEWVTPIMKGYLMKCCDCGLVHEMQFRALQQMTPETKRGTWWSRPVKNGRIEMRARRRPATEDKDT